MNTLPLNVDTFRCDFESQEYRDQLLVDLLTDLYTHRDSAKAIEFQIYLTNPSNPVRLVSVDIPEDLTDEWARQLVERVCRAPDTFRGDD